MRSTRLLPLVLACSAVVPVFARAQAATAPAGMVMQVEVSQRWMNGRQRPEFTPHTAYREDIAIDSVRPGLAPGARTLFVHAGYLGHSGVYAHDGGGRPLRVAGFQEKEPRSQYESLEDSSDAVRWRMFLGDDVEDLAVLPGERIWELVPAVPAHPLRRGERWSDTLDLADTYEGFRQALTGRRASRVVRDTIVGGRRLWIVVDSARVRYTGREIHRERTLDTLVAVDRDARGIIVGRYLFDPRLRMYRARHDTTVLSGHAVLRYPDGRAFPTPARFERGRAWTLTDSAALAVRDSVREAEAERGGNGIVEVLEDTSVAARLANGDARLRDSLVVAWRRSRDPERRAALIGPVLEYATVDMEQLATVALEDGDTAWVVGQFVDDFYSTLRDPVTERRLRWLLPVMDDPALAFSLGLERDPVYEDAAQGLATHPPVITEDRSLWPCTPAACQLLAAQWTAAREPRLRQVGLFAAVTLDPRRWADTVLAHAPGSVLLRDAALLVRGSLGYRRQGVEMDGPPLPAAGAGWRAWRDWMSVNDLSTMMFNQPHQVAIRFHQALTGRDVMAELRRARDEAAEDSARLVYGTLLRAMGEAPTHTPEQVYAALAHGTPAERELALGEAARLLSTAPPADTATVTAVVGGMLASMIDGAPAWPWLLGDTASRPAVRRVNEGARPLMIAAGGLSPALRERWDGRARLLGPGDDRPDRESSILYTVRQVVRVGPFARVRVDWSTRYQRRPDQAPRAYAGGASVDLVWIDGEWRAIGAGEWVT